MHDSIEILQRIMLSDSMMSNDFPKYFSVHIIAYLLISFISVPIELYIGFILISMDIIN